MLYILCFAHIVRVCHHVLSDLSPMRIGHRFWHQTHQNLTLTNYVIGKVT